MLDTINDAVEAIKRGEMIVVVDDEDRENEGDLIMSASKIDADKVNFMATYGKGLICVPLSSQYAVKYGLKPMVSKNTCRLGTNFTVSVDYKYGVSTGISMADRARTISALSDFGNNDDDFTMPGHVFPIIARDGGVLERPGHTEAAVEFMRLAGLPPVGVICEIIKEDGEMARLEDLLKFSIQYEMKIVSIKDLVCYLSENKSI